MKITTDKVIVIWCAALLIWEGWTCINKTPKDTISERVWEWAKHLFVVRFGVAFLFAHFFFQRDEGAKDDVFWRTLKQFPVLVTFLGLFAGYVAWQRAPQLAHSETAQ